MTSVWRHKKRQVREERLDDFVRAKRLKKSIERKCWWAWPWGHLWQRQRVVGYSCEVCGKNLNGCNIPMFREVRFVESPYWP